MHFVNRSNRSQSSFAQVRVLVAIAVAASVFACTFAAAEPNPGWWIWRGVVNATPGAADDFAVLNQGQLKNFTLAAVDEFKARLAPVPGGPGAAILALEAELTEIQNGQRVPRVTSSTLDFAPASLGQVKALSKPFHDRLIQLHIAAGYPWSGGAADDFAIANLGQAKNVFNFDFLRDSDGDGLSDLQEITRGSRPDLSDTDGDGIPDGEESDGDQDRDGLRDFEDPDRDGDGVLDGEDLYPSDRRRADDAPLQWHAVIDLNAGLANPVITADDIVINDANEIAWYGQNNDPSTMTLCLWKAGATSIYPAQLVWPESVGSVNYESSLSLEKGEVGIRTTQSNGAPSTEPFAAGEFKVRMTEVPEGDGDSYLGRFSWSTSGLKLNPPSKEDDTGGDDPYAFLGVSTSGIPVWSHTVNSGPPPYENTASLHIGSVSTKFESASLSGTQIASKTTAAEEPITTYNVHAISAAGNVLWSKTPPDSPFETARIWPGESGGGDPIGIPSGMQMPPASNFFTMNDQKSVVGQLTFDELTPEPKNYEPPEQLYPDGMYPDNTQRWRAGRGKLGYFRDDGVAKVFHDILPDKDRLRIRSAIPYLITNPAPTIGSTIYFTAKVLEGPAWDEQWPDRDCAINVGGSTQRAVRVLVKKGSNGAMANIGRLDGASSSRIGVSSYGVPAALLPVEMMADYNHDRKIDDKDRTLAERKDDSGKKVPFYFWMNDDDDDGNTTGTDIPTNGGGNGIDTRINGTRDLVDLFPVYLNIKQLIEVLPPSSFDYKLQCESPYLNYLDTDLTPGACGDYLTKLDSDTQLLDAGGPISNQLVKRISGTQTLDPVFLAKIKDQDKGIILLEAWGEITKPLKLVVTKKQGGEKMTELELPLSIKGVEKMFHHKNVRSAVQSWSGQTPGEPDRYLGNQQPENYPDKECINKNFVFIHGYNVNGEQARGWQSEAFKRMYWSGSRAKFYGVSWAGDREQRAITGFGLRTPNFHKSVYDAFASAHSLQQFIATLQGDTTIAAHSLGNVVTASAQHDWGMQVSNYYLANAALSIEELQSDAAQNVGLRNKAWRDYEERLWASEWHALFAQNDNRSTLTWRGRVANYSGRRINFYSDVSGGLGDHTMETPPEQTDEDFVVQWNAAKGAWIGGDADGKQSFCLQERLKGKFVLAAMGSTYGGWKFNLDWTIWDDPVAGTNPHFPGPDETVVITNSELRQKPFFDDDTPAELYGANGSQFALQNRNLLLCEIIPARSLAVGGNPVPAYGNNNFDMQSALRSGWPAERTAGGKPPRWWHSDLREVGYIHVFPLYDKWVELGVLK